MARHAADRQGQVRDPHRRARADVDDAVQLATSGGANPGRDVLDMKEVALLLARGQGGGLARPQGAYHRRHPPARILVGTVMVEDPGPEPVHARGLRNLLQEQLKGQLARGVEAAGFGWVRLGESRVPQPVLETGPDADEPPALEL